MCWKVASDFKCLLESGVQTQVHYPTPLHIQKAYLDLGYNAHLPVTEKICSEVLSFPMYPFISNSDFLCIDRVIKNAIS
jgi:dTDP-4-amino-4,6-dideoxygalactose transaminase